MKRFVLLLGFIAGLLSSTLAIAQEKIWGDAYVPQDTLDVEFGSLLDSPIFVCPDPQEGGPASFTLRWHTPPESEHFNGYFIYIFLTDPSFDTVGDQWTVICEAEPLLRHEVEFDLSLFLEQFGERDGDRILGLEGRVWVSLHKRDHDDFTNDYLTPITNNSVCEIFFDTVDPLFSESTGLSPASSPGLDGGTSRNVLFSGDIEGLWDDEPVTGACTDPHLVNRLRLYFDDLGDFEIESDDLDEGIPYIDLDDQDGCAFSIPLTLKSGSKHDKKHLSAHIRDLAHNVSDIKTFDFDFFQPATAQAYPNPFIVGRGNDIIIQVLGSINTATPVQIFGPFGRVVRTLSSDRVSEGNGISRITWDGKNGAGSNVSTGVYLYVIETENGDNITGKIAVVK